MTLPILGRYIASLAGAILVRLHEREDLEHIPPPSPSSPTPSPPADRSSPNGTTPLDDATSPAAIPLPPGLVHRTTRSLEATAGLLTETRQLAAASRLSDFSHRQQPANTFPKDAAILRQHTIA